MGMPSLDEVVEKYGQQTWHICPTDQGGCGNWSIPIDWESEPPRYTGPCINTDCNYEVSDPYEIMEPPTGDAVPSFVQHSGGLDILEGE